MDCSIICKHTVPLSAFLTSFFSIDHPKLKVMLRKKSLFLTGHSYRGDMLNYWQLEVRVNNYCIYADFKGLWNFHRTPKSSFSVGHQLKCGQGQEKKPKKTRWLIFFFLTMQKHKIMKLLFYLEHFGTLNKLKTVTILMFGNVMNCECTLTG